MFEQLGFETLTAPQAALWFALVLGCAFGALAQITRLCFRRMIDGEDRRQAAGIWLMALATATLGTQAATLMGWIDFAGHRFMVTNLPVVAIVVGGFAFGAGMILTRGCVSRLTVLSASGNLRALLVLVVFAIVAHATLKGVLSGLHTSLKAITMELAPTLPGTPLLLAALIAGAALVFAWRSGLGAGMLGLAALLGLLVPLGWVGTGYILFDDFDPIALQSLSFTAPVTETLFWVVASTAIAPGFGVGLMGGTVLGAGSAALLQGQFAWSSFDSPRQTARYLAGAGLMGFGAVLAGGCTVGAGLSGVPTLSFAAILALTAIALGGALMRFLLAVVPFEHGSKAPNASVQPAT
ncbi:MULTISPECIES: YeeE/YedE family protein [unclassified Roseobacter]|uniref:YeeE/YedE family protein n=1 Tax=unclassified Roseobacter TaxID=196798 RepID=UPI0030EC064A